MAETLGAVDNPCSSSDAHEGEQIHRLSLLILLSHASFPPVVSCLRTRSLAIEDETDEITNTCDGGSVSEATCRRRVGYGVDKEET